MIPKLGPLDKQWMATGIGNVVDNVTRLARAITEGDLRLARYEYLYAMRAAVTLAERFSMPDSYAEELGVTFVVNGDVIPITVPPGTPLGWARDMAIARSQHYRDGAVWEMRVGRERLVGCDNERIMHAPHDEIFVTFAIGVGA